MKIIKPKYLLFLFFLIPIQIITAQELLLRKGAVVDSLTVSDSLAESFAMYLPRNYSSDKKWPIVFVFDPEGRGINAARLFSIAAEKQGYLIASSNNISSGDSLIQNLEVASRLLEKVLLTFPINEDRVYTAGAGKGSVVASSLPAIYTKINSILVVNELWMNNEFLIQNKNKYSLLGISGYKNDAYNTFPESFRFFNTLKHNTLNYNYESQSDWPSASLINDALGSFTLQAMNKGLIPRDTIAINALFDSEMATAESWRRQLNYYRAYEMLDIMREKYKYFDKKDEIRDLQKKIRRESIYKEQRSQYFAAKVKEQDLRYRYPYLIEEDIASKSFENVGWWAQQIKVLDSLKKSEITAEAEIGYRLKDFLRTYTEKRFQELKLEKAGIDKLILVSILRTIFDKENPEGYFAIVSLSAQDGDYYTAMLYLEDLLKTGYKDMDALYDIPGTLDLKLSPEFNELIKKYLGESKYYNIPISN